MEIIAEHTPSIETRRLDSLARLLESNMTCAAVCLIGNTLYITTNDIYAVSTKSNKPIDNQGIKYLKMATKHFLSKSFHESEAFTDDDINILLTNYKGKFNSQYKGQPGAPNLQEDEIKRIISHLLNTSPIKIFMDIHEITLGFFEQFLNKSDKESIPRSSHVFEKIIEVQRTFLGLWRDVRDYKKFKKMVMQKQFNIERYCILAIGQKDEHAEMRMLGFLLNQEKILTPSETQKNKLTMEAPIYIGISKLCCPYCNSTLNVFNTLLLSTNDTEITTSQNLQGILPQIGDEDQDDDEVISSENLSEKAVSALIQMSHENTLDSTLEVRGSHDLRFKWIFPAFARDIDETKKWTCQKVKKVKDVSADSSRVKPGTVCYEDTKKDLRCVIISDTSISKEGRKNVFNVSPCVIEFSLAKDKVADNTVNAESLANACRSYYCPGYKSQLLSVSILPGEEKIIEVWIDLEAKLSEKANLSCLQSAQFNKKLLVAYETVNKRVVDVSVSIKMVPSASTSSAEDLGIIAIDKMGGALTLLPTYLSSEESDHSGEAQHAEESAGESSDISRNNSQQASESSDLDKDELLQNLGSVKK